MSSDQTSPTVANVLSATKCLKPDDLPTLHETSMDKSDSSIGDVSKQRRTHSADTQSADNGATVFNQGTAAALPTSVDQTSGRKGRMLPKIPLNAKMFDVNKRITDISNDDVLNSSRDSSNVSDGGAVNRTLGQRANSTLDISRTGSINTGSNPSLNTSLNTSRESDRGNEATLGVRTLGKRANSSVDISLNHHQSSLNVSKASSSDNQYLLSRSFAELSPGGASNPGNNHSRSSNNILATRLSASELSGSGNDLSVIQIVDNLEKFSAELSNLAHMNDKLQFAEESIDRLEIAIAQQQQQQQQQLQRRLGTPANQLVTSEVVKDQLLSARSEVERLRVINDNVGREIAENQKHLHDLDAAVKSKRSGESVRNQPW